MKMIYHLFAISIFCTASVHAQTSSVQQALQKNCPQYQFQNKEYSLAYFNPAKKTVYNVTLPAHDSTLFRGTTEDNQQFSLESVVLGIFGQRNWHLGSPLFWGLTDVLMGQRNVNAAFLPNGGLPYSMLKYAELRSIDSDLNTLLSCKTSYTREEANILAQDLLNKSFSRMDPKALQYNFFNMKNPRYYSAEMENAGLGNNAIDFVISSYNDQVAGIYGSKILILHDARHRSLDLGFWNYTYTGQFWDAWVDNGEVNTPGYITADEVLGFQQRKTDRTRGGLTSTEMVNPILYSVNKLTYKGQVFALLLDGKHHPCIIQSTSDNKFYFCEDNWSGRISRGIVAPPSPKSTSVKDEVPLVGVFSDCQSSKCISPKEVIRWYGKISSKPFPYDAISRVQKLSVNGNAIQFVKAEASDAPKGEKQGGPIEVLSATFANTAAELVSHKGNVTDKAKSYADGKTSVTYKISSKFLGVTLSEKSMFEMIWRCGQLDPQKILIAAPAEGNNIALNCESDDNE